VALLLAGVGFLVERNRRSIPSARDSLRETQKAIETRDFEAATKHLQRCLEFWPLNGEAHFLLARISRRQGDFTTWRRELHAAQLLQWSNDDIDLERLLAQVQIGNLPDADQMLQAALAKFPAEEVLIWEVLVKGYREKNEPNQVLAATDEWIKRHPDDWLAYFYRGYANLALGSGKSPKAVEDFRQALEFKPDLVEARFSLAYAYTKTYHYQEALEQFQACLQRRPNDPVALLGVATCQLSLSEPEAARAALDALPEEKKNSPDVYVLRAKLAWIDGKAEEALKWLKRAEPSAPADLKMEISHTLVQVLVQLKRYAEAEKYRRQEEELRQLDQELTRLQEQIWQDPTNVELRFQAAMFSYRLAKQAGPPPAPDRENREEYWLKTVQAMTGNRPAAWKAYADYLDRHGEAEHADSIRRQAEKPPTASPGD
jgi:tetratricopeptide (TPR) repeat protein